MFWVRFRSGVILAILTLFTVILGGNILFLTISLISIIGLTELYKVLKVNNSLIGYVGYLACVTYDLLMFFGKEEYDMLLIIAFLMVLMFAYVLKFPKYHTSQVTLVYFGLFYVSFMLSYIYKVRMLQDGAWVVWLIFIGAWGSDTCAYLVGRKFGKNKIFPNLSPKKSAEGCVGGVLGAMLIGFIYATIFRNQLKVVANPQLEFAIISGASSLISQTGDLAASAIKRNHDIKDYGKLIPGHGGILDRYDSIIFTAPIVFYLTKFL